MYEKILAGVDGSEFSIQALYHAVELSLIFDSELTVISVVDDMKLPFSAEYGLWARESHDELTRKVLESLNRVMLDIKAKHPELKIEARIEKGRPAKTIVDIAEKEDFNLIVVGKQGYGLVTGLILGSTSNEIVNISTKPVLIIK